MSFAGGTITLATVWSARLNISLPNIQESASPENPAADTMTWTNATIATSHSISMEFDARSMDA